jgi:hydroxymethylglutaryl-CoA synthase
MLTEIYALDASNTTITGNEDAVEYQNKLKEISKSEEYKEFVTEKLMPAEIASSLDWKSIYRIYFMGLLSTLAHFTILKKRNSEVHLAWLTEAVQNQKF